MGILNFRHNDRDSDSAEADVVEEYDTSQKSFWQRIWPVAACGAGLFSVSMVSIDYPECIADVNLFAGWICEQVRLLGMPHEPATKPV